MARDQFGPESDIDILALLPGGDDMNLKKDIVDLAYDIELKYNIIFGSSRLLNHLFLSSSLLPSHLLTFIFYRPTGGKIDGEFRMGSNLAK